MRFAEGEPVDWRLAHDSKRVIVQKYFSYSRAEISQILGTDQLVSNEHPPPRAIFSLSAPARFQGARGGENHPSGDEEREHGGGFGTSASGAEEYRSRFRTLGRAICYKKNVVLDRLWGRM